jgi:hypothetical protein
MISGAAPSSTNVSIGDSPMHDNFKPSGYTRKDYVKLQTMAKSSSLKRLLYDARYRDKRVQRNLDRFMIELLTCPLDDIGLHVNEDTVIGQDIIRWRLSIGK